MKKKTSSGCFSSEIYLYTAGFEHKYVEHILMLPWTENTSLSFLKGFLKVVYWKTFCWHFWIAGKCWDGFLDCKFDWLH